jgi:hypothetical protein
MMDSQVGEKRLVDGKSECVSFHVEVNMNIIATFEACKGSWKLIGLESTGVIVGCAIMSRMRN